MAWRAANDRRCAAAYLFLPRCRACCCWARYHAARGISIVIHAGGAWYHSLKRAAVAVRESVQLNIAAAHQPVSLQTYLSISAGDATVACCICLAGAHHYLWRARHGAYAAALNEHRRRRWLRMAVAERTLPYALHASDGDVAYGVVMAYGGGA